MSKTRILILAANPWKTDRLSLDEEQRNIQELWDKYDPNRERFDIRYYPALRGMELQEKLLGFKPHLLHFTGHGENKGIILNDASGDNAHEISKQTLAEIFKLCAPDLKAVFLNACYSANQADEIAKQVDYVVGMNAAINDLAAIHFSQGFYTAIFTQKALAVLDIEAAFNAGLNQMEIAKVSVTEQNKPTLLPERFHTFVPGFKHDVFISFADADAQWTKDLSDYLGDQLKQKLGTADGFQLYTGNDLTQLEHSATLLVIASPEYCQQYQLQFTQLEEQTKRRPVFLLECDACNPRPTFLNGFSPRSFWYYDQSKGMMQKVTGDSYFVEANKLVLAIADCLKELSSQRQHQENIKEQRQKQQEARPKTTRTIDAFVFLNSAPEDLDLTAEVVPLLEENGIDYVLPLKRTIEVTAADIRQDIENNILNCDAVLILYEQTTPVWVREQLGNCRRLQRKRDNPLRIIAVCKSPTKPELDFKLDNLHVYCCETSQISNYIEDFVEAL